MAPGRRPARAARPIGREVGDDVRGVRARAAPARGTGGCAGRRSARPRPRRPRAPGRPAVGTEVERDARPLAAPRGPHRAAASPCASSRWCAAADAPPRLAPARRVHAAAVAENARAPRLVERDPARARGRRARRDHERRSRRTARRVVAVGQPPRVLQRLRQVPVVQRRRTGSMPPRAARRPGGRRSRGRAWLTRAGAVRQDPRPGDREAVGAEPSSRISATSSR